MKNFPNYLTFALFASLILFASCGGDDEDDPSDEEITTKELTSSTAVLVSVTNDNNGDTELDWLADTFSITFTGDKDGGTYAATGVPAGGEAVWPSSGSWTFVEGSQGAQIERNDGIVIGITTSETELVMSFDFDNSSARVKDVSGSWVFNMEFQ